MPTIRFTNTTHQNGQFRSFPPDALQFWREHGSLVGLVLRPECALTFAELAAACQEIVTADISLPLDETYIAWVLIKLLEYGMAAAVPSDSPRIHSCDRDMKTLEPEK